MLNDKTHTNMEITSKSIAELNLTALEVQVLESFISQLYAEAGYSDVDVSDLVKKTGIPSKTLRGVLGSLVKKEIVSVDKNAGGCGYDIIYLKEEFWYLHSEDWASESRF
jgi:predicted transcriptional regulator